MSESAEWRSLYPFASNWLALRGGRYHYVDEGAGEPLLLVHGNPTWSFYWRNLIAGLKDQCRLVAPDHIGCGLSDKPQTYNYRLAQHTENLIALIEQLDLRNITLVAHDWGGAIGMGAAAARPDRFARLVLMNTAAYRSTRIPWRIAACRAPVAGTAAVRGANAFLRAALLMATERPQHFTPEVQAGYLAPYDSWANRVAIDCFVKDIPLGPKHPSYNTLHTLERCLPSLADLPMLLVWGMKDWCFTPHFLERFLEFFPMAETRRIEWAGHWVVEDASEETLAAIRDFLARHPLVARTHADDAS